MSFTERFIELPIMKYSNYDEELMGKDPEDCERINSIKKINQFEIESYEPAIPKDKDLSNENEIWTAVTMKSGDEFFVRITIKEFETLLNNQIK